MNELHEEAGVTRFSLENGRLLKERHGAVVQVALVYSDKDWYQVHATYADGHTHIFTGFSWGYKGEGPRGLAAWAKDNGVLLTPEKITETLVGVSNPEWEWVR